MHYLPLGARLNKGILMVTQLNKGFFGKSGLYQNVIITSFSLNEKNFFG